MAFDGNEGEQITLAEGAALTKAYRDKNPSAIKARFFGRDKIEQILAQTDCKGLRLYYGYGADGTPELVMVGADSNENDMLNIVLDVSVPCPHRCSSTNPLNSDTPSGSR